jgi:hypothetical protein
VNKFVQVRCPTPTPLGTCNRWQHEVADDATGLIRFKCKHCKETTIMWSSQAAVPVGLRHAVR